MKEFFDSLKRTPEIKNFLEQIRDKFNIDTDSISDLFNNEDKEIRVKRIALFDMDGTLFDHNNTLKNDLLKLTGNEEEIKLINESKDFHELESIPYMKARINLIRMIPGWWLNLPKWQPGWDIYQIAKEIGFCCKVLTKGPRSKPLAWMEKVQCIHKHFGDELDIDIVGKAKDGTYGRILVDDYPDYITDWLEFRPRGLVIMPAHNYNEDFKHENVIRYDGANLNEVKKAMYAVWRRGNKQHWKECL